MFPQRQGEVEQELLSLLRLLVKGGEKLYSLEERTCLPEGERLREYRSLGPQEIRLISQAAEYAGRTLREPQEELYVILRKTAEERV